MISGLPFFVNVVKIQESDFFVKNESKCLEYVFAWLNLDLGITTCFFKGLNGCVKVGLQFVQLLYLLFLVLPIVAVYGCGQWVGLRALPWVVRISDKEARVMGSKTIPGQSLALSFCFPIPNWLDPSSCMIYRKADIQVFQSHFEHI